MENQGEGCRRPLRPFIADLLLRLLPPLSSTSPAAHPPHPLATSPRVREGRSPRPLLGDVITTPRHDLATDRPATSSDRAAHRRSAILPTSSSSPSSSILQDVMASQSRRASRREGRERTRAKDAADLFARSSPLFCSVCCLHCPQHHQTLTPSPARNIAKGEGRTVTPSASGRCHRHTSPPHRQRTAATGHRLDVLPSCPPRPRPLPFLVVVPSFRW